MQRLKSKLIDGFAYDKENKLLTLWMANGQRRQFIDVPSQVINELVAAPSPGMYYKLHIKPKFTAYP